MNSSWTHGRSGASADLRVRRPHVRSAGGGTAGGGCRRQPGILGARPGHAPGPRGPARCAPRLEVYEQVEVARVVGHLARDGAEHPQMARTVATSDCYDVSTPGTQLTERHLPSCWRCSRLPHVLVHPSHALADLAVQRASGPRPAHRPWLAPDSIHTVSPPGGE
jgi:hypothetical protein